MEAGLSSHPGQKLIFTGNFGRLFTGFMRWRFKKGYTPWNKGKTKLTDATILAMSEKQRQDVADGVRGVPSRLGQSPWNKGMKMDISKYPKLGHHGKHSPETIEKIRANRKGITAWNKGLKITDEAELKRFSEMGKVGGQNRWRGHVKGKKERIKYLKIEKKWRLNTVTKETHAEEMRRWRANNRERDRYIKHRRKMMMKGILGSHTQEEWEDLKKRFDYMCLCCKRQEPEITLTRDHIVPITKGGTDNIWNIQPLCANCNTRKFTKTINYMPVESDQYSQSKSWAERRELLN